MRDNFLNDGQQNDRQIFDELEDMLKKYDKIILIKSGDEKFVFSKLSTSKIIKNRKQKILILSTIKQQKLFGFYYKKISNDESKLFYQLYHMYEFSNRFQILSKEECYGNLFNFVFLGLLSYDEMFEVLLE